VLCAQRGHRDPHLKINEAPLAIAIGTPDFFQGDFQTTLYPVR
jgi:hypothetical protein